MLLYSLNMSIICYKFIKPSFKRTDRILHFEGFGRNAGNAYLRTMISLKNSKKCIYFLNPEKLQLQIIFLGFEMSNREVQKKVHF